MRQDTKPRQASLVGFLFVTRLQTTVWLAGTWQYESKTGEVFSPEQLKDEQIDSFDLNFIFNMLLHLCTQAGTRISLAIQSVFLYGPLVSSVLLADVYFRPRINSFYAMRGAEFDLVRHAVARSCIHQTQPTSPRCPTL
jgi:hypothetical protein